MEPSLEEIFGSYMSWKLDDQTWIINFMAGTENMYLLEGDEKALLIDTGYGAGNLRDYVEKLTDKPIVVANTHYHPDHAAGNGEFEQIYMSKNAELDKATMTETPFDLTKLPHPDYKKVYVGDGDTIELGNRTIEILDVKPAHCNSSLFFLDRSHRMFFCGDDMEAAQVNLFNVDYDLKTVLDNFLENTERILSLSTEFDYLLPNHNGAPIAKSYLNNYIDLIHAIYNKEVEPDEKLNHRYIEMDPKAPQLCRVRGKNGSIITYREQLKNL